MGASESKKEHKTVDTTGNVNNNLVIGGQVDVFSIEIIVLLGIICIIKTIELIYFLYSKNYHRMKKRIVERPGSMA